MPPKAPAKSMVAKTTKTTVAKPAAKGAATKGTTGTAAKTKGAEAKPAAPKVPIVPVDLPFKSVAGVLLDNGGEVGEKIQASGKWPLVIDVDEKSMTFLRYRDCNIIDVLQQHDVQPETLRMGLLGALRYHKPMVINLDETDDAKTLDMLNDRFNEIYPGLLDDVFNKSVMKEEKCSKLVRDSDPADYQDLKYGATDGFKFILMTKSMEPSESLKEKTFPVVVVY